MSSGLASSVLHRNTRNGHPWEIVREQAVGKTDEKLTNLLLDLDASCSQVRAQSEFLCIAVWSGNYEWFSIISYALEAPIK